MNGLYVKSSDVNGKPSWASDEHAMWYSSGSKCWIIGSECDIGVDTPIFLFIYTKSQTGELPRENSIWFDISNTEVDDIEMKYFSKNCHVVQNNGQTSLQRIRDWCTSKKPKLDGKSLIIKMNLVFQLKRDITNQHLF